MDGKTLAKLAKDCDLIDKKFTTVDIDIIFAKIKSKGARKISPEQFYLRVIVLRVRLKIPGRRF